MLPLKRASFSETTGVEFCLQNQHQLFSLRWRREKSLWHGCCSRVKTDGNNKIYHNLLSWWSGDQLLQTKGSCFILCIHCILHMYPSQFSQLLVNYQLHSVNTWRVSFHSEYRGWAAMSAKENLWFCLWIEKIWHFPENSRAARGIGSLQWCFFLRVQACVCVCM